ncbi:ABC transporter substrate-binding protein [Paenibacillus sp. EPM92]|uniref:ABC transporter substrate-binding protein n=1 Tax=Paenibacillus sp. EPM92 TaxID=1561195 RepID=UPI0019162DA8|nr:ABC transporter substrate-binding protein [Paenibacillus sp. EPM92]
MKTKTAHAFIALVVVFAMILSGCTSKEQGTIAESTSTKDAPKQGGTLIVGLNAEITVLDPSREAGWETFRVNRQIHESLVTEDLSKPTKEVPIPPLKPALAESWKVSEDGLIYTFHLRRGVNFHDGTPFNAAAVEFNIRRAWDPQFEYYDKISAAVMQLTYNGLKEIKTPDDYTVELIFEKPFSPFLRMLAQGSGGTGLILSPTALKKWGNDGYAEHPVGTGPFQFVERIRGEKIELKRFDGYWGDKPYLDKVIFRPIPDDNARVTALETGEIDIISWPSRDSVAKLRDKGFKIGEGDLPSIFYYAFNFDSPYFKDPKIRQAFIYAIDREGLARDLLKNTVSPAFSIQNPGNEAFDPNFKDFSYNPEKAKALLKEAGYPEGFETKLITYAGKEPVAEWIQRDLAKVGIKLKIQTYDWNSYLAVKKAKTPDIGLDSMEWGFVTPYWLYIVAHSNSGSNSGKYVSPAFDQAVDKAILEPNQQKSITYWKEANKIIAEDAGILPIYYDRTHYAIGKNVNGFVVAAQDWYDLNKVWIKQ